MQVVFVAYFNGKIGGLIIVASILGLNGSCCVNSYTDLLDESTHTPAICLMVALVPGGLGDKLDKNRFLLESKASYISSAYVLVAGSI